MSEDAFGSAWRSVDDSLPEGGQRVLVAAWEFESAPSYFVCVYWRSLSGSGQWYLDATYGLDCPASIADYVRYWMEIPVLPGYPI